MTSEAHGIKPPFIFPAPVTAEHSPALPVSEGSNVAPRGSQNGARLGADVPAEDDDSRTAQQRLIRHHLRLTTLHLDGALTSLRRAVELANENPDLAGEYADRIYPMQRRLATLRNLVDRLLQKALLCRPQKPTPGDCLSPIKPVACFLGRLPTRPARPGP